MKMEQGRLERNSQNLSLTMSTIILNVNGLKWQILLYWIKQKDLANPL